MDKYFDNKPVLFRILFGILSAILITVSIANFYRSASTSTDENIFTNPPSAYYITQTIEFKNDTLQPGDFILGIGEKTSGFGEQLFDSSGANLKLKIWRPRIDYNFNITIPDTFLTNNNLIMIGPAVLVTNVYKDGASDRAGLQVGDLITKINNQTFGNSFEADQILRNAQVGKSLEYEIRRGSEVIHINVVMARFGMRISILIFILSGIFFIITGVFLAMKRPRFAGTRYLGLIFVMLGYFMTVLLYQRDVSQDWFSTLRNILLVGCVFLSLAMLTEVRAFFPKFQSELLPSKWFRIIKYNFYIPGTVLIILFQNTGLFISIAAYVLMEIIHYFRVRKLGDPEARKITTVLQVSIKFAFIASFLLGILISRNSNQLLIGFVGIPMSIIPLTTLYTIGRYRLFELDLRVRKNIQYNIISAVWIFFLINILFWTISWLSSADFFFPKIRLTPSLIEISDTNASLAERSVFLMLASILISYLIYQFGKFGKRNIDKFYYRSEYNYQVALDELSEVTSNELDKNSLAKGIVAKLAKLMHLKKIGILFFNDRQMCCCKEAYGFSNESWERFCLVVDDIFTKFLFANRQESALNVEELPYEIGQELKGHGFRFMVLIKSKDALVGVILIGGKMSESPFNRDDLQFLKSVARQSAVAIENSYLYDNLAEQERMKHELKIARQIQVSLLPESPPESKYLQISGISRPAMEVGGDFFDYLPSQQQNLTVILGDVSGKGTSAALYMAKVQGIFRSLNTFELEPKELFIRANQILGKDLNKNYFVTVSAIGFDVKSRNANFARAGHMPLYVYKAENKEVEIHTPKGMGIGLSRNGAFEETIEEIQFEMTRGDVYLLLSDGINESMNSTGEEYGEQRIADMLQKCAEKNAADIRDCLMQDVKSFTGEIPQHDDQTLVIIKII